MRHHQEGISSRTQLSQQNTAIGFTAEDFPGIDDETYKELSVDSKAFSVVDINSNQTNSADSMIMAKQVEKKDIKQTAVSDQDLKAAKNKEKEKDQLPALRVSSSVSIPLRYICLGVLVIQTSTNILTLRYSRTRRTPGEPVYLASTAVLCTEILKLLLSYAALLQTSNYDVFKVNKGILSQLTENWKDGIKLAVPALMYVVQNNLLFLALSKLDAATYQVTYQLKILTTALFSVTMLGRRLNPLKWASLLILMVGVGIVQMPQGSAPVEKEGVSTSGKFVGIVAVLMACVSSGFSGVYFEKIIKGTPISMWMRNLQLAFFSIIIAIIGIIYNDLSTIMDNGFFQGYHTVTWVVICSQGVGGLIIGAVVKYADNILKGFATSISIVVSSLLSYYILDDFTPSLFFVIGSTFVLVSTYLYSLPA